jgi:hypothetical protein
MGPGYFPFYLGVLLAVLGLIITGKSFTTAGSPIAGVTWRGIFFVTLAVVLFGALLKPLGLIGAGLVPVIVGSIPSGEFKWKEVGVLSVILLALCTAIFVYGLKLPIGLWPERFR